MHSGEAVAFTVGPEWGAGRRIDFPIDPRQSCAFCGRQDWAWLYPLLAMPSWRPTAETHLPWFWCACDTCADLVEPNDSSQLIQARLRESAATDESEASRAHAEQVVTAFFAFRSGDRLSRADALSGRAPMLPDAR